MSIKHKFVDLAFNENLPIMASSKVQLIITTIDKYLENSHKEYLTAVEAAALLDKLGILKDSIHRRGLPLRNILRADEIPHAYQVGVFWKIPHSGNKPTPDDEIERDLINPKEKNEPNTRIASSNGHKLQPIAEAIAEYLINKFRKPAQYIMEYSPAWLTAVPDINQLKEQWPLIKKVYADLVDQKFDLDEQLKLIRKPGSQHFDIWFDDPYFFAVEFDEEQHFNQFRAATLKYYNEYDCSLNLADYETYCEIEKKPGTSGFQKLKSQDPLFPEMYQGSKQDNRIRQRAFRDFLKDIVPISLGYCPTVRIPYHVVDKKKSGFTESNQERIVAYIDRNGFVR